MTRNFAFSDESQYNTGRYRSICLLTCIESVSQELENVLAEACARTRISEMKWEKIKSDRYFEPALEILKWVVQNAEDNRLRIDVLVWDITCPRHDVKKRDDIANLGRMHYHLLRAVLKNRWESDILWNWYPDNQGAMDWTALVHCLQIKSSRNIFLNDLATDNRCIYEAIRDYHIADFEPSCSKAVKLIQVADIFAGMTVFSYSDFDAYIAWLTEKEMQNDMFGLLDEETKQLTNSQNYRSRLMDEFLFDCKQRKLGVGIISSNGLSTKPINRPISFWLWESQHENDIAPVKSKSI